MIVFKQLISLLSFTASNKTTNDIPIGVVCPKQTENLLKIVKLNVVQYGRKI